MEGHQSSDSDITLKHILIYALLHVYDHKGTFETVHIQDATGHEFATRLGNVFTIGKGTKQWVSLPKSKGIKLTIIEEARKRLGAQTVSTA